MAVFNIYLVVFSLKLDVIKKKKKNNKIKKSGLWETLNLLTDADSSTVSKKAQTSLFCGSVFLGC